MKTMIEWDKIVFKIKKCSQLVTFFWSWGVEKWKQWLNEIKSSLKFIYEIQLVKNCLIGGILANFSKKTSIWGPIDLLIIFLVHQWIYLTKTLRLSTNLFLYGSLLIFKFVLSMLTILNLQYHWNCWRHGIYFFTSEPKIGHPLRIGLTNVHDWFSWSGSVKYFEIQLGI